MVIVPLEADGVFAHGFGGDGLGSGLEHGEGAGREFRRFPGLTFGFVAFFVAHGAGAGVAEKDERIMGNVAVGPRDVHAGARGQVDLD